MRTLLILGLIFVAAALLGWLHFSNDADTATIAIDKLEVQEDTLAAAEKIEEIGRDVSDKLRHAIEARPENTDVGTP